MDRMSVAKGRTGKKKSESTEAKYVASRSPMASSGVEVVKKVNATRYGDRDLTADKPHAAVCTSGHRLRNLPGQSLNRRTTNHDWLICMCDSHLSPSPLARSQFDPPLRTASATTRTDADENLSHDDQSSVLTQQMLDSRSKDPNADVVYTTKVRHFAI